MGELRTVSMKAELTAPCDETEELLVDKTMRIKKIELHGYLAGAMVMMGILQLSKRSEVLLTKEHGHLAYLYFHARLEDAGVFRGSDHILIDLGSDYVEVEEDDSLFLRMTCAATGAFEGVAIIYYEE